MRKLLFCTPYFFLAWKVADNCTESALRLGREEQVVGRCMRIGAVKKVPFYITR